MPLSADQRKRVAWLKDGYLSEEDMDDDAAEAAFDARWEQAFAAIASPEELYLFASESHPAQEPHEWRRVLDHPLCDRGAAHLVFWRNSPVYMYGDEPAGGWERERYELVREIAARSAAGGYPSVVRFDPAAFKNFSFLAGHPPAELERVPAHMREPTAGEYVPPLEAADFEWDDGEF